MRQAHTVTDAPVFFMSSIKNNLLFILFALCFVTGQSQASGIDDVQAISRAGAPDLALSMIDRFQPHTPRVMTQWVAWEQARLGILEEHDRWSDLIARVSDYPEQLPEDFLITAQSAVADAYLKSQQPVYALEHYRKLIWSYTSNEHLREWRQWRLGVIEAYLALGQLEQSLIAWRRFEQDFDNLTIREKMLRAELALQTGHPDESVEALRGVDDSQVEPLRLLATLLTDPKSAKKVSKEADKQAQKASGRSQSELWWVAARATRQDGRGREEIQYLQKALKNPLPVQSDPVFSLTADQLWDAYKDYGEYLGNSKGFLVGDDEAWLKGAAEEKDGLKQTSFFVIVALEGQTSESRETGHAALIKRWQDEKAGAAFINNLYLRSSRFPAIEYVPEIVRPTLAEYALEKGNSSLASDLMRGIDKPPLGSDSFDWDLRRARIHILGGHEDLGIDVLYGVLARYGQFTETQADRFLQVLFDLQTLKRDKEAIALFTALQPRLTSQKQLREVLFWIADSYKALGQYEQAGYLYLRSALFVDNRGLDPWGQTARFFAAENLEEAGLIEDARSIYQGLYRVAQDENRKIVLRQRLQQLQLQE
jgi:hypothetical protein